jgi:transposase
MIFSPQENRPEKGAMKSLLKLLQNIKNTVIESIEIVGGPDTWNTALILHVRPTKGQMYRCPICKKKMPYYDEGQGVRDWRALDLGVIKVYLRGKAPRVKCMEHGIKVASVPWARHGSWFTYPFEEWVTWITLHANRSVVSECCRIDWHTVGDVIRRVEKDLRALRTSRFDNLINIGIDETSYRKGHRYLTVVVDHDSAEVIWVHKEHGKAVLTKFFESLTEEQRTSIKCVTGDGATWITECVSEFCPYATRLLDAFHIVAWATEALDNVRKRIWNEVRKEEAETIGKRGRGRPRKGEEKPASKAAELKGSRFALLKNPEDLTRNQQVKLEMMAGEHDELYRAYLLKERLRLLLKMSADETQVEIDEWISWAQRCRIPEFVELSGKIRKHRKRIMDTVASGMSNARVEGINNKIKVITKRAYGFRNIDNLIAMIYLCCSNLPFALPGRKPIAAVS